MENAIVLSAFCTSIFSGKFYPQEFLDSETRGEMWSKVDSPLVEKDLGR